MRWWFLVLTILLTPSRVFAGDFEDAQRFDEQFRFAEALAAYERASDPKTSIGAEAASRANVLREHAEGGFLPFVALEKVRRSPSNDAVARLAREADAFPPGRTRIEAWVVGAESALAQNDDTAAEPLLRKIVGDAQVDPVLERKARRDLVTVLLRRHAFDEARLVTDGDPLLSALVMRLAHRRYVHFAAMCAVIVMPFLAVVSIVRRRADAARSVRALAPIVLVYVTWLAIVGGVLSASYESGTSLPFVVFAMAAAIIILFARAWGATGSTSRSARIARAVVAALAALAAGFLVLEHIDVAYLDSLGI